MAQISFEGPAEPVACWNSPNGQNYLAIDPLSGNIAFTEENGGVGDENTIAEKLGEEVKSFVFRDWLGTPGMVSPIGFVDGGLLYNHVIFNQGMYFGLVMQLSIESGDRKPVLIPYLKNKSAIQSGCISDDGRFMILSIESNDTYGVEDLYVTKKGANGDWSSLSNLGAMINTPYQEITPFLAPDNKTLFFATNGREGSGSFDLFYAERQDDSWRNWSEPTNLGNEINSSGAETSMVFRAEDDWAYFVSSKDSDGYGDILRIRIQEEFERDISDLVLIDTTRVEPKRILLKVVDAATHFPLPAGLLAGNAMVESVDGLFEYKQANLEEEIEIKSKGYLPVLISSSDLVLGENIIELSSIAKGNTITLDHVLFHRGTADLIDGSQKELDLVVEVMNDNPSIKILLKGHTDNTGDPVLNVKLSEERVKTVKAYLVDQGINAYRITGKGYGGNQPIASNASEITRKRNRRVEFEVIED